MTSLHLRIYEPLSWDSDWTSEGPSGGTRPSAGCTEVTHLATLGREALGLHERPNVVGVNEVEIGTSGQLVLRVAEHAFECRVYAPEVSLEVDYAEQVG